MEASDQTYKNGREKRKVKGGGGRMYQGGLKRKTFSRMRVSGISVAKGGVVMKAFSGGQDNTQINRNKKKVAFDGERV